MSARNNNVPHPSARERRAARGDHLGVEARAVLEDALLRLEIDMHQPEAHRIAEGPFEVVHQRPGEIAAQVDAGLDRVVDRPQVLAVVVHPQRDR